jgi:hypothetical protein
MKLVSDQALWSTLHAAPGGRPISKELIGNLEPAAQSPYATLIANACGKETLDRSWWAQLCPGPCNDPRVARSASLMGHAYFVRRNGHWLIWANR